MLPPPLLIPQALAAPLLGFVLDVAEPGLRAWWQSGDLLVGPPTDDPRPGMRPLAGNAPVNIPADLSGWIPLGETCQDPPSAHFVVDGREATATRSGTWAEPIIQVEIEGRVVALGKLGSPAEVCQITVGQADVLPGPEVMVSWRLGAGPSQVRGLTVFRLPATAR